MPFTSVPDIVADEFKADTHAIAAARFLLADADQYYTLQTKFMDDSGHDRSGDIRAAHDTMVLKLIDSLRLVAVTDTLFDTIQLSAHYIINNIKEAYNTTPPLGLRVPRDTFFEYVLPYRVGAEKLEEWRPYLRKRYTDYIRHIPADSMTLLHIVKRINVEQTGWIFMPGVKRPQIAETQCLSDFLQCKLSWSCNDITTLKLYTFRALGIPAALEIIPVYGKFNFGHKEVAVLFENGRFFPSMSDTTFFKYQMAKMYRVRYSHRRSPAEDMMALGEQRSEIPPFFFHTNVDDITSERTAVSDVILTEALPAGKKVAYLCVYNAGSWMPVEWSAVGSGQQLVFPDMGRKLVYQAGYVDSGRLRLTGRPFMLDTAGVQQPLLADAGQQEMQLQKYDRHGQIEAGKLYTLYYWQTAKKQWHAHQTVTATAATIKIPGVPKNGLYRLHRDEDKLMHERMFIYKDGQQLWF
ncbi:hypothetical protein MKQ68_09145 [Chitinophaga horti]|uniref:Uncharacterized protein n=1 Tax=Chitinophaga horti TaxID=2920382 RepID=A0ABY6JAF8_9BACT|nr:hypothetical protein [Chitinophaga horti]UYQ95261.1 hypothetical protein MKQ68_09145 [Chitinophaga horti]